MTSISRIHFYIPLYAIAALLAACGGGTTETSRTGASSGAVTDQPNGAADLPATPSPLDVTTFKYDNSRTGQNIQETTLTPATVNSTSFGLLHLAPVDGVIDGEPLFLSQVTISGASHNVAYAATEHDSVYAIDADTGATLWQVSLLTNGDIPSDTHGCGTVSPEIGVTATPVIDRTAGANGAIYVVAMSLDTSSNYHQRLHALDITTGAELFNGPVEITASFTNAAGTTTFEPGQYMERTALLLANGQIYTTWASHCDSPPYGGWIISFNQTTLAQTGVLNVAPNSGIPFVGGSASNVNGPAIWMSGAGPAADSNGNVYLLTANGQFETTPDLNGFPSLGDYGNSFLRLVSTGSTLSVADYFTMSNEVAESFNDQDLGSGGIMLLPDLTDTSGTTRQLAVGGGKDGSIYVVQRGSMGRFNASANNIWQSVSANIGALYSSPAYFNGSIYVGGSQSSMQQFSVFNAKLSAAPVSTTQNGFQFPGLSPVVSANGNRDGIVWAVEHALPSVLHAFSASQLSTELYNSTQAAGGRDTFSGAQFSTPTVASGKVFVGGPGNLAIFGLLQ